MEYATLILALAAVWLRIEHRLTKVEDKLAGLPCAHPDKPAPEPTDTCTVP